MAAWLTTILRNCFLNERRRAGHMVEDPKGSFVATLASQPEQEGRVQACELRVALGKLPVDQREAIILVGGQGLSYLEAAEICHCAVGTIKSRVSRARAHLARLMSVEDTDDFGPDRTVHAALGGELCWAA
jgi:RNA polymerase sigma-70 factor, ECF subfamily